MSDMPRMSFTGVWPTLLIRRRLPGFEQPTAELAADIQAQEAHERDLTARYQSQDFFVRDLPAVRWLKDQIDDTTAAFLEQHGVRQRRTWTIFGWYNVNRRGDHHAPHTHPRCYLSGTYYVSVPPARSDAAPPDAHPSSISFYDPRTAANMIAPEGDPDRRSTHVVHPSPGTLLMWPSPVQHYVHPNLSDEQRISISFNVIINAVAP